MEIWETIAHSLGGDDRERMIELVALSFRELRRRPPPQQQHEKQLKKRERLNTE